MGLVRIVVDANWNTGCSDQPVSIDWVPVGDYFGRCVRPGFPARSLPTLQTVLSEEERTFPRNYARVPDVSLIL